MQIIIGIGIGTLLAILIAAIRFIYFGTISGHIDNRKEELNGTETD